MELTKNIHVTSWINEIRELTSPDRVVWIDGSEEQLDELRNESYSTGEMIKLNLEKLQYSSAKYLHNRLFIIYF